MAKKSEFNPTPLDADNDGLVQEGTEFERLAVPEFASESDFKAAIAEPAVEGLKPSSKVIRSYAVVEGDSWASVASKTLPAGKSKHEWAKELLAKHGNLTVGKVIEIG